MAEALRPGGVYKDATGDGYHDANGKAVKGPTKDEQRDIDARERASKQQDFNLAVAHARQKGLPVMHAVEALGEEGEDSLGMDSPKPPPAPKTAKADSPKPDTAPKDGEGDANTNEPPA